MSSGGGDAKLFARVRTFLLLLFLQLPSHATQGVVSCVYTPQVESSFALDCALSDCALEKARRKEAAAKP
jgi:hypothetical protein